jgi:hypothetical protein
MIKNPKIDNESLLEAAKPLIKYLNENCCPHVTAIVDSQSVELVEGIMTSRTDEFLTD